MFKKLVSLFFLIQASLTLGHSEHQDAIDFIMKNYSCHDTKSCKQMQEFQEQLSFQQALVTNEHLKYLVAKVSEQDQEAQEAIHSIKKELGSQNTNIRYEKMNLVAKSYLKRYGAVLLIAIAIRISGVDCSDKTLFAIECAGIAGGRILYPSESQKMLENINLLITSQENMKMLSHKLTNLIEFPALANAVKKTAEKHSNE